MSKIYIEKLIRTIEEYKDRIPNRYQLDKCSLVRITNELKDTNTLSQLSINIYVKILKKHNFI